jgi:hypothetical protein
VAAAQTSGTAVEAPKALLSPEKQALVRTYVSRSKPPVEESGPAVVGQAVPPNAALIALPEDTMTEVPKTTSFKFLVAPNGIAVVDPESRQVVQIISR